jgi:hypothetical protein
MHPAVSVAGALGLILVLSALFVWWRFDSDIKRARDRVAHGSQSDHEVECAAEQSETCCRYS